jgi:hypothetical protein
VTATFVMARAVVTSIIVIAAVVTSIAVTVAVVTSIVVTAAVVTAFIVTAAVVTAFIVVPLAATGVLVARPVMPAATLTQQARSRTSQRAARGRGRLHLPQRRSLAHLARVAFTGALLAPVVRQVVRRELRGLLTRASVVTRLSGAGDQKRCSEHAAKDGEGG